MHRLAVILIDYYHVIASASFKKFFICTAVWTRFFITNPRKQTLSAPEPFHSPLLGFSNEKNRCGKTNRFLLTLSIESFSNKTYFCETKKSPLQKRNGHLDLFIVQLDLPGKVLSEQME